MKKLKLNSCLYLFVLQLRFDIILKLFIVCTYFYAFQLSEMKERRSMVSVTQTSIGRINLCLVFFALISQIAFHCLFSGFHFVREAS